MLEFARAGDTIVVWKLDRLARSIKQLIETVDTLRTCLIPENAGFWAGLERRLAL